jgi:hypothetical protein
VPPGPRGAGAAPYDGADIASLRLLAALQGRMAWRAAARRYETPPLPVYASPAQLVQAHPRATVWVLSAFLATPRFADAILGRAGVWRALLGMLELKRELPALPIIDARPGAGPAALARAAMQAVCVSPAAGGGGGAGGEQQRRRQQQQLQQQQQQQREEGSSGSGGGLGAAGGGAPLEERAGNATGGQHGDGGEALDVGECRAAVAEQQQCGDWGGLTPRGPGWLRPLSPGWWRRQWRQLRAAARRGAGAAPPPLLPAAAPVANCTVWTAEGQRVGEFTVRAPPPPPPLLARAPPQPRWRSWLAAARRGGAAWAAWLLWPRWRLLRLLPLLQPELKWVYASVVVAGAARHGPRARSSGARTPRSHASPLPRRAPHPLRASIPSTPAPQQASRPSSLSSASSPRRCHPSLPRAARATRRRRWPTFALASLCSSCGRRTSRWAGPAAS